MATYFSRLGGFFYNLLKIFWLSITSYRFYHRAYYQYQGYGLKYMLTLSYIFSFFLCLYLLVSVHSAIDILNDEDNLSSPVNQVFQQLPTFSYDGESISVEQENYNKRIAINSDIRFILIDLENEVKPTESADTVIVMRKKAVTINLIDNSLFPENFIIPYNKFLGGESSIIEPGDIRNILTENLYSSSRIIIYVLLPSICFVLYCAMVYNKIFIILCLYILCRLKNLPNPFSSSFRVVMFASGFEIFFSNPPYEILNYISVPIQFLIHILLFYGVLFYKNTPNKAAS